MVNIITDIDPISKTDGYDVILIGTNVYGKLSNGWQLDMKVKYPFIHKANLETGYGNLTKLGKFIVVKEEKKPIICLLYVNNNCNFRPDLKPEFIDYDALKNCLHRINIEFKNKKIICPIIGASKYDGNGDKDILIEIFKETCTDVNIDLYDYDQLSSREKTTEALRKIMKAKEEARLTKNWDEYNKLNMEQREYSKRLKEINNLKNIN